jgi:FHS family L-fucose permease-like MFS transporter
MLIGVVVTVLGIIFAVSKVPDIVDTSTDVRAGTSLMKKPHLVAAVLTQFCYVGAQIALWALFINYIRAEAPGMSAGIGTAFPDGWTFERAGSWYFTDRGASRLLSGAFLCFLLGRISGSMALRSFSAHRTLAIYGLVNAVLMSMVVLRLGWISVFALFVANFFMSIMFPTIFSLGDPWTGRRDKARVILHSHGDRGRSRLPVPERLDLQQVDGPGLHRPADLLRRGGPVRLQLGEAGPQERRSALASV